MEELHLKESDEIPILTTIQKIKDKQLDPVLLSKEMRQQCVEVLMFEGYTEAQIAQVLGRSQKTIKRDLDEIWRKNSEKPNMDLALKIIGDLITSGKIHHVYLMRLARRTDGSIAEKSQAEIMAWTVKKQMAELLQTLGYLPMKPRHCIGDFFYQKETELEEPPTLRVVLVKPGEESNIT